MDNIAAERALKYPILGHIAWLFFGNQTAGDTAARLFTLTKTCNRLHIDSFANLQDVYARLASSCSMYQFCVVSERHMDHILRRAADWYNHRRCHSARGNLPPVRDSDDPPIVDLKKQRIVCDSELGGHLKSYRAAGVSEPGTGALACKSC